MAGAPRATWRLHGLLPSHLYVEGRQQHCPRRPVRTHGFKEDLLDFVEAGPKMRRWYGEGERLPESEEPQRPEPQPPPPEQAWVPPDKRQVVLVTDGDSPTGTAVILQLVLARARIKALTRSRQRLQTAFGSYVEAVEAGVDDLPALQQCLADVRTVICTGPLGALAEAGAGLQLPHLVLLAAAGPEGNMLLQLLLSGEQRVLRDLTRQALAQQAGVPCTIIRSAAVLQLPGGQSRLTFDQAPQPGPATIAREDLACVLAQAALHQPPKSSLAFSVAAGGDGVLPSDWQTVFDRLQQTSPVR